MPVTKHLLICTKTRRHRPLVSPSLTGEAAEAATMPPFTLDAAAPAPSTSVDDDVCGFFFRPLTAGHTNDPRVARAGALSPSLSVRSGQVRNSPSLYRTGSSVDELTSAMATASSTPCAGGVSMTTAVCKRASRMARPAEPSEAAMRAAVTVVCKRENELLERGLQRMAVTVCERFKMTGPATGKGPAVKADTGDANADIAAQSVMNHVRITRRASIATLALTV